MSNLKIRTSIENDLKNKFVEDKKQEWVNVHIDAQNFIDIKIVSDHINNRRQAKSYVKDLISAYPEYKMGMIRIYSVEEAIENEIVNSQNKNRPSNLVEAIDYMNNSYKINNDKKITITDIYAKVEGSKDENISGNLYVVPAGKLNTEYIYKLSKIQPNLVSRNNYISDLIKDLESKQELNLDFVLVDSRTGINDWGGMSLIDVSDKVVFFVYPNDENMEGSRSLMNLVKNSKRGNMAVVFSRVDVKAHDEAIKFYDELNEELDLNQDYIEISYDPDIAISKGFPVRKMLGKCESIVDMILDSEGLAMNKQLFEKVNRAEKIQILEMLGDTFSNVNVVGFDKVNRDKINEENIYLILSESQDLLDEYTKLLSQPIYASVFNDGKVSFDIKILDNNLFNSLEQYLNLYSWKEIWNSYIIKVINDYNSGLIEELKGTTNEIYGKDFEHNENVYSTKLSILINNSNWLKLEDMLKCLEALKYVCLTKCWKET